MSIELELALSRIPHPLLHLEHAQAALGCNQRGAVPVRSVGTRALFAAEGRIKSPENLLLARRFALPLLDAVPLVDAWAVTPC